MQPDKKALQPFPPLSDDPLCFSYSEAEGAKHISRSIPRDTKLQRRGEKLREEKAKLTYRLGQRQKFPLPLLLPSEAIGEQSGFFRFLVHCRVDGSGAAAGGRGPAIVGALLAVVDPGVVEGRLERVGVVWVAHPPVVLVQRRRRLEDRHVEPVEMRIVIVVRG